MCQLDNGNSGYVWKKEWVYPYESLWGIVEKFKFLNAMNSIRCKGFTTKHVQSYSVFEDKQFYIFFYQVDYQNEMLAKFLDISIETHFDALKKFSWNTLNDYMERKIKICPICISKGYHSYIHQLFWEDTCFLHPGQKLIETSINYLFEYSSSQWFKKNNVINTYIESSADILQHLVEQDYVLTPLSKWGCNVVHLGIIYEKELVKKSSLINLKKCLKSILYGYKIVKGFVRLRMPKSEAISKWSSYEYYDESKKLGSNGTWFSDYCYYYAEKLATTCDKELFKETLLDFNSSVSAAVIRNRYFDYNHFAIAIIITSIIITGYTYLDDVTNTFCERWKKKKRGCIFEEKFANYIENCNYNYQKTAFIELYKLLIEDIYKIIQKKAQLGEYAYKTYQNMNFDIYPPIYLIVEKTNEIEIIEINE